jgi:pimeloyl-ACP methyl ester carboxylesterase
MSYSRDCPDNIRNGDVRNIVGIWLVAAALLFGIAPPAGAASLTIEDYAVSALDPGIKLFVRNKRPSGMADYTAERTVLFVHGSTYPAEATFDLALGGYSWMDVIAERGFDVYLLDLRGYGRSSRPEEMNAAPASNQPIVTTEVALRDVATVAADILQRRQIPRLSLIGWSWGTTIAASYAIQNPDKVGRLVLYGAQWLGDGNVSGKLGAYRTVDRTQARDQWLAGVSREQQNELIPGGWFDRWADAIFASDPVGAVQDPPVVRAPNGTVLDSQKYWRAGIPFYDPEQIVAPVLLIHGEWDRDTPSSMSRALFRKLKNAAWRRYVMIGEATHMLMLEKNRQQLFEEVQLFLEREETPKPTEILQTASSIAAEIERAKTSQLRGAAEPASSDSEKTADREPPKIAEPAQVAEGEQEESATQAQRSSQDSSEAKAAPPTQPESRAPAELVAALMKRGEEFLALGDISAARLFYARAADSGSAQAMTALGKTYDPEFTDRAKALGVRPDPAAAADWYRKAMALDGAEAAFCIGRLKALGQQ